MKKNLPFITALAAGLTTFALLQRQQRRLHAQQWARIRPQKALITGASAGIGEVFARALARRGYDLVLLARREERLRALAEELRRTCNIEVEILVADLANPEDLERAAGQLAQLDDLDLLVNNAGMGVHGRFAEVDTPANLRMIQLNLVAAVRLARAVLPGMLRRGRGGIINVSSVASFLPTAGNHTYGATKTYLNFFTRALADELAGSGVRVQALCPGYTYTEFHDAMGTGRPKMPAFLWLNAEDVVAASLRGLEEGQLMVVPGAIYKLAVVLASIPGLPRLVRVIEGAMRRSVA